MFPVSTKQDGQCIAFPDACLVPPVPTPTPFPNLALCRDAEATSSRVLACNKEVVVENSIIPQSSGDEAGSAGGVVSGMNKGPCRFTSYSSRVFAEGKKVVVHTSTTGQNGVSANAVGCQQSPSQSRVLAAL
jgi:Toxin PAAR-like domain